MFDKNVFSTYFFRDITVQVWLYLANSFLLIMYQKRIFSFLPASCMNFLDSIWTEIIMLLLIDKNFGHLQAKMSNENVLARTSFATSPFRCGCTWLIHFTYHGSKGEKFVISSRLHARNTNKGKFS